MVRIMMIDGQPFHPRTMSDFHQKFHGRVPPTDLGRILLGGVLSVADEKTASLDELQIFLSTVALLLRGVILAETALRDNIKLVHISSGCIFKFDYRMDLPVNEDKIPDYFDLFYSRSKIYSDRALEVLAKKFNILIVRMRIPLLNQPHPRNILDKLIKYKHVIDLPNSVTYIPDFIRALKHLLKIDARGIYNVVNKGGLSYPKLLDIYKRYVPEFSYEKIDFRKLGLTRTNLLMSTRKLEKSGFKVRNINSVLEECVKGYLGTHPQPGGCP